MNTQEGDTQIKYNKVTGEVEVLGAIDTSTPADDSPGLLSQAWDMTVNAFTGGSKF